VNAVTLRKPDAIAELTAEVRELTAEIRAMRADQRRRAPTAAPRLLAEIEEKFGPGRFTVRGLLQVVDEDSHGALAEAVALLVDMNASARSRATQLGALLARLPEIEIIAERPGIYRLRREG
jgi:hypothetical protein